MLDDVDRAVPRGLVTLEGARLATGADVADAACPAGPGNAAKLTVYCGTGERHQGRPAYREAVAVPRRAGASGAIVLPGVDGTRRSGRRRARLFSANGDVPMVIISVGPVEPLRRSLPDLAAVLPDPLVTLEPIMQVKHDGKRLGSLLASAAETRPWQTIRVYARRNASVHGRPLYSELTRRLRESGGAGATTVLGDWGFSSDERPTVTGSAGSVSHRPTYTVHIDRPDRIAAAWPVIDELTAEHGIVTSLFVPGYRERTGATVHGSLDWD